MVPDEHKLPWFDAACCVVAQIPYVIDDIRRPNYRWSPNVLAGACYCASEAIHHLTYSRTHPYMLYDGGGASHWFLRMPDFDNYVIDVTASQFERADQAKLHGRGRRKGFATREPSKRAQLILDRIYPEAYFRRSLEPARSVVDTAANND